MSPLISRGDFATERANRKGREAREEKQKNFALFACFAVQNKFMEIGETLYVTAREDFRKWLTKNHQAKKEIWLVQYKKATKKPSIPYVEAVEEAICFGWIDSVEKSMDSERYATRFTPRRPKSNWTNTNKERARKMIAQGKMTKTGRETLPVDVIK
jgi:uncharacterized protein YdeI (YjbR/CyaY-like superfamily)